MTESSTSFWNEAPLHKGSNNVYGYPLFSSETRVRAQCDVLDIPYALVPGDIRSMFKIELGFISTEGPHRHDAEQNLGIL